MIKKIYILFIIVILSNSVFGQFVGKDDLSVSLFYMQKNELDSAKKYIDQASNDSELKTSSKTWYYKGLIYKELYKSKEKDNKTSSYRLSSIEAYKTMWTLEDKEEFTESSAKIVKFLASTLYNDAVRMLTPENYETAIINFDHYKNAMSLIDSGFDVKSHDIKFKLALASMLNNPNKSEQGLDSLESLQVKNIYVEILSLDEDNGSANYNLAIAYYNEGADIVRKMDYDMDLEALNKEQDRFTEIFLKALPYMKKSYELKYNLKETLLGLSNIYEALNDEEKSVAFKKELQDLEKE